MDLDARQSQMRERQRITRLRSKGVKIARIQTQPVVLPRTWLEQVLEYREPRGRKRSIIRTDSPEPTE